MTYDEWTVSLASKVQNVEPPSCFSGEPRLFYCVWLRGWYLRTNEANQLCGGQPCISSWNQAEKQHPPSLGRDMSKSFSAGSSETPTFFSRRGWKPWWRAKYLPEGNDVVRDFGLVRSLLFSFHHCLLVRSSTRGFRLL